MAVILFLFTVMVFAITTSIAMILTGMAIGTGDEPAVPDHVSGGRVSNPPRHDQHTRVGLIFSLILFRIKKVSAAALPRAARGRS
jgi:hypothetical protein